MKLFRFRGGPARGVIMVTALACALLLAAAHPAPKVLEWDFATGRDVSAVGWPADNKLKDVYWIGRQDIHATVKLPGNRVYQSDRVRNVYVNRAGSLIGSVKFCERSVTRQEAIERVRALGRQWGMDLRGIPEWEAGAGQGSLRQFTTGIRVTETEPGLWLHIIPAAATPERPWYVQFEVFWSLGV